MAPELSIIIVSWNVKEYLRQCLHSVYNETAGFDFEVIVVDNASRDGTVEMLKQEFPQVQVLSNSSNVGYAKANNQAIRMNRGKYVLLLNPDTIILNNAIGIMRDFMDSNPSVGIATPKILNSDRTIQICYGEFPSVKTIIFGGSTAKIALQGILMTRRFFEEAGLSDYEYNTNHPVEWVMGSFMIARKEAVEEAGLLDENLFMYGEEPDWCYRMALHGWKAWYVADAEIIHHGGKSTEQVDMGDTVAWLLQTQYYFFNKHFGRRKMAICHAIGQSSALLKQWLYTILAMFPLSTRRGKHVDLKRQMFNHILQWHRDHKARALAMGMMDKLVIP